MRSRQADRGDGPEETTKAIWSASLRTALCALLLNVLLWTLAYVLACKGGGGLWFAVLAWALFAWSVVVSAYAVLSFWRTRQYLSASARDHGQIDSLTGLPNRQALMAQLERAGVDSHGPGMRIRLVDVDLVNLNKVNYEFGQMVGDAVLQDIADLLRQTIPKDALLGRLGGDEFLVILPEASMAEAESLGNMIGAAVAEYRLNLGEQGIVKSVKANVSVASYLPEQASLHEAVTLAKESSAHGKLAGMETDTEQSCYHAMRVTLGAFAVHRWQDLSQADQQDVKLWQSYLEDKVTNRMVGDILRLLDEKIDENWVDYVAAVPAPGGAGGGRTYPARHLGEAIADKLGVPYREVMRAEARGPDTRTVEPIVDAALKKGDGILLISDVISSGIVERKCVKKLSTAGAHVHVIAWAAY